MVYLTLLLIFLFCKMRTSSASLEHKLKESLQRAMTCHSGKSPKEPVIALSPKRFLQAIALIKKDSRDSFCVSGVYEGFDLEDPRTWGFCAAGDCLGFPPRCRCYRAFKGESCSKFHGRCWLMYCRLNGCESNYQDLSCSCDTSEQGKSVTTGHFWYDEGLESHYRPPPSFGHWHTNNSPSARLSPEQNPKEKLNRPVSFYQHPPITKHVVTPPVSSGTKELEQENEVNLDESDINEAVDKYKEEEVVDDEYEYIDNNSNCCCTSPHPYLIVLLSTVWNILFQYYVIPFL